jgi:hypothetical protein
MSHSKLKRNRIAAADIPISAKFFLRDKRIPSRSMGPIVFLPKWGTQTDRTRRAVRKTNSRNSGFFPHIVHDASECMIKPIESSVNDSKT